MLKKFLTTIIVLAATATAWADGWGVDNSVTSGGNGNADGMNDYGISVITWSESESRTLAEAITEANNSNTYMIRIIGNISGQDAALSGINKARVDLSQVIGMKEFGVFTGNNAVKYVLLPDNTSKENVDALGKTVDAAASKKAHTKTVWKYNAYDETGEVYPKEYTGVRYNETVVDGIAQATGKVSATVDLSNSNPETLYTGKVFYDKSGNAYGYKEDTQDDSKLVELTPYTERYTYADENGAIRLWPNTNTNGHTYYVVSENGGYVGVQDPTTVTVAKKDVKYTYKKGGKTYAYNEEPKYKIGSGQYVICEGGTEFSIQEENTYTLNEATNTYNSQNGRLVTNNNKGHVDGTKIPLTKVSAYYVLKTNNIYEGPIRIDGEKAYGHGGTPVELSLVYYYKVNDNGTDTEAGEGFYVSYDDKRIAPIKVDDWNYNGTWWLAKKEGDSWYIDYGYGNGFELAKDVTEDKVYKSIDGSSLYVNWNSPKTYNVSKYDYKYNGTSYDGQVYTEDGKYYGYTDGEEIELENRITYVKDDNTVYTEDVYTYNNEYFGYDGGTQVTIDSKKYFNYYGTKIYVNNETPITLDEKNVYWGYNNIEPTVYILELYNKTGYVTNDAELPERVYKETYGMIGLIGGTVTDPVTYSAEGYYYTTDNTDNTDNTDYVYTGEYVTKANDNNIIYGCTDNSVLSPLEAVYQYTYTDPITGETVVYETMEQESSVTVTHEVELTSSEESAGKVHLIAYVSKPGSLTYTLARWSELDVTNGKHSGYDYTVTDVTALTLSGDVNYADIGTTGNEITAYGHVVYTDNGQSVTPERPEHDKSVQNSSPAMNGNALTYLDLEDAVFAVQTDMQFSKVNGGLKTIILPTDNSMTLIPDNAFNNLQQISELCIPYNYTTIGSCAFHNTHSLMHIYTTDDPEVDSDDETIVDNGPYTYTFSANLKEIEGGIGTDPTFFGNDIEYVTDIYVLAEKAPLCGANAFAGSMTYGNNGFAGNWTHPICRENYINSNKWICVLHYPSSSTDEEAAKYTDITRNYTLIDEVGNVDGDGKPIAWPRHAQFWRSFNQATMGYIWSDWEEYAKGATEVIQIYDASIVSANPTKYDRAYQGWHEFVLVGNSRSRDFDPQKENREYIQRDWYTICVPYDLTRSQLLNMLGVVNSEAEETVYALEENEGKWEVSETGTAVTQNLYPDVRALTHVSRDINENGTYVSGKVTLHLSEPLIRVDENGNVTCSHVDINEDGQGYTHATLEGDDPVVMEGGHAYLIRPYVPKEWNDQIKNLGMYIMAMADSYNNAAVSAGLPAPYSYNEDCKFENKVYLPCFKHKIHAVKGNGSPNTSARYTPEFVYEDAESQSPAYYRFVGTYTQTTVPQYAYYLGKNKTTGAHQFFRTTKETTKWNPYSAVIVGLSSNPNYTGVETSGQTGIQSVRFVSDSENDLRALAGEVTNPSNAGKSLSFEQLMGDANGEATGIVDVNVSENVNVSNNKVYSINGQYMGTSLNNLPKGIYIINGQKKVVK